MAALVFNIAKGKAAYYAGLPAASDALVAILCKSSGMVSDATLKDYDSVAAVFAGATDEASFSNYARKTLTGVSVTVNDTTDTVSIDADDVTWSAATSGQALAKLIIAYVPNTGSSSDSDLVPLFADDFSVTTDGNTLVYQVASGGFYSAS